MPVHNNINFGDVVNCENKTCQCVGINQKGKPVLMLTTKNCHCASAKRKTPKNPAKKYKRKRPTGKTKTKPKAKPQVKQYNADFLNPFLTPKKEISVMSWNVASVNANPFEYWMKKYSEIYDKFMTKIDKLLDTRQRGQSERQELLNSDQLCDFKKIEDYFNNETINNIISEVKTTLNYNNDVYNQVLEYYNKNLKSVKIIDVLHNKLYVDSRMYSHPDKELSKNTKNPRPALTTTYEDSTVFNDLNKWQKAWTKHVITKKNIKAITDWPDQSKAPLIEGMTPEMRNILGVLFLFFYDASFIIAKQLTKTSTAEFNELRNDIIDNLVKSKTKNTCQIIHDNNCDIVFLQEVGHDLKRLLKSQSKFKIYDSKETCILIHRNINDHVTNVELINNLFNEKFDICALRCKINNYDYVLASFHADGKGKQTPIFLNKLSNILTDSNLLIAGMDANCVWNDYGKAPDNVKINEILEIFENENFINAVKFENISDKTKRAIYNTTNKARTFFQAQTDKAVSIDEVDENSDKNPKDHIFVKDLQVLKWSKMPYGKDPMLLNGPMLSNGPMPSKEFPSDHAIIEADIELPVGNIININPMKAINKIRSKISKIRKTPKTETMEMKPLNGDIPNFAQNGISHPERRF